MSRTKEELLVASDQIRRESQEGANSAERVGSVLYDITEHLGEGGGGGGDTVSITPVSFSDGVKVADYSINGNAGQIKAPNVSVARDLNEGTPIARITVNGQATQLYAPEGGSGGDTGYQKVYFANVAGGTVPSAPQPSDYDANTDAFTTSTPQWYRTNTNPQEGQDTYAIWVYFNANGNIVTIDGPVCLTGAGTNGEDGEEIEWIYIRRQDELSIEDMGTIQRQLQTYCKTGDNSTAGKVVGGVWTHNKGGGETYTWADQDVYPESWTDNAQGIDESNKYEYAAFRRSRNGNDGKRTWGDDYFHGPMLWSAFGKQGMDGDGVEYIFYADATGNIPTGDLYDPSTWKDHNPAFPGEGGKTFDQNEYIAANSGWTDDPIDLSNLGQGAVEWVSMRKKQNGEWQSYSTPAVWSRMARDGGAPKEVDYIISYFKAMATHTAPNQGASSSSIDDPQDPDSWWTTGDPDWGANKAYLYCQEKTVYKNSGGFSWGSVYFKGQWTDGGGQGQKGDDGYTLVVDPSYAIFEETSRREDAQNNPITDSNIQDFDHYAVIPMDLTSWIGHVQLLQGSTPQTIGFADGTGQTPPASGIITGDNCTFKVTVTDGTGDNPKGLKIEVQSITSQVTTAKMRFWITLNNSLYCLVEIPIYVNRLGTRFQYIVGDSETTVMKKTVFTDIDGTIYKFNNVGDYLRSSSENISTLKTTIGDSNSGLVQDVSQIKQTADEINLSVQNGYKNYIVSPMASTAPINNTYCSAFNSSSLGSVVQVSDNNDYDINFKIDDSYANLSNKTVTIYMLVRCTDASSGAYIHFGWKSDYDYMLKVRASAAEGEPTVDRAADVGGHTIDVGTVRMADSSFYLCYRVFTPSKLGDLNKQEYTINTVSGTWLVHSVGIVAGSTPPTISSIINYNGVKSAGIDITQGQINLKADTTNFLMSDGSVNPNVVIDHQTGTLKAINGEFSGTVLAGTENSNRIVIDPTTPSIKGWNPSSSTTDPVFELKPVGTVTGEKMLFAINDGNYNISILPNKIQAKWEATGTGQYMITNVVTLTALSGGVYIEFGYAMGTLNQRTFKINLNGGKILMKASNLDMWPDGSNSQIGDVYLGTDGCLHVKTS